MPISFRSIYAIFITVVFSILLIGCDDKKEQADTPKPTVVRPVKTLKVEPAVLKLEKTYSAIVEASQQVDLSFRVAGKIIELPIRSGKHVKKDDVIAQLDKRDFLTKITQVKSQLKQAQDQMVTLKVGARVEDIASQKADVAAAQAQVDAAVAQVGRTEKLFKEGFSTQADLDKDVSTKRVADATLEAKKQALLIGQRGARKEDLDAQEAVIAGLQSKLESSQDTLSDTTLRAPFDGIIATREVENFSNIQAKATVAVLQNLKTLKVGFDVPSPDVAELTRAKKLDLKVILDSLPGREFVARQDEFSTQADTATQTYRGSVIIENLDDAAILPGMTGNLIITSKKEGTAVFMLPLAALASSPEGKPFVWIVNMADNKTTKRNVVVGEADGADITISEGLKAGDVVVTAGISALQDGMVVKPITAIGE